MRATILIPTHAHAETLPFSIRSALEQTLEDIEVFVVGDGVSPSCAAEVTAWCKLEPRLRFFNNPKGERHGERWRHNALQEASGAFVAYLCDDDLLLPHYLEAMEQALKNTEAAHPLSLFIDSDGMLHPLHADLTLPHYRTLLLNGYNRIPLTGTAQTLRSYRSLPYGWRPAPPSVPTDLFMWQQMLQHGIRWQAIHRLLYLHFPSSMRKGWSNKERLEETQAWYAKMQEASWRLRWAEALAEVLAQDAAAATAPSRLWHSVARSAYQGALALKRRLQLR